MADQEDPSLVQREVLVGMRELVRTNLSLLTTVQKSWQPTDFLPDLSAPDWLKQLERFRKPVAELGDDVLVVLIGDMVTEEALPSYAVSLNLLANDATGNSDDPWAQWMRGWTAEENRHGDLLNAFLRLTGRVDTRAIEVTIQHLIAKGFNPRAFPDLYAGLLYTCFQERATRISHNNVAALAGRDGNEDLAAICRRIAGDEARHERFYTRIMSAVMQEDPVGGVTVFSRLMKQVIAMPGRLMYDGKDPDLFDHFAVVAQRIGVYTVHDYAAIAAHLIKQWKIATLSVSGKAAKAQEYLCRHVDKLRHVAAAVGARLEDEPMRRFSWIHNRLA